MTKPRQAAQQEPVAWRMYKNGQLYTLTFAKEDRGPNYTWEPLYTAPTPRKPLTDEEIRECAQAMDAEPLAEGWPELIKFARAIERKHGITNQETN